MTVREMHIDVEQAMQQLGANKRRKLISEEIDWILNKNMLRVIDLSVTKTQTSSGYVYDRAGLDKLRNITVKTEAQVYMNDIYEGYAPLPPNCLHTIADESYVTQLCNNPRPAQADYSYVINRFKLPHSSKPASPYYKEIIITKNSTEIFRLSTYVHSIAEKAWEGLKSRPESFFIRGLLLDRLQALGELPYWETYDMRHYPGELIIVSASDFKITIDGTDLTKTTDTISRKHYSGTGLWKKNRLYSSADAPALRNIAFYSTYYESPLSEVVDDRLFIYTDKSFIVSKSLITYIRRPRKISLILGQDCELSSESVQQNICDLSVEYIKKIIEDPSWETKLQDNIQRTTI